MKLKNRIRPSDPWGCAEKKRITAPGATTRFSCLQIAKDPSIALMTLSYGYSIQSMGFTPPQTGGIDVPGHCIGAPHIGGVTGYIR